MLLFLTSKGRKMKISKVLDLRYPFLNDLVLKKIRVRF